MRAHYLLAAFVAAFSMSFSVLAEKKSLDTYWKEVGLKFSFIEEDLSSQNCYSEERAFIACVYAVNSMLALRSAPVSLVASTRLQSETGFGTPVETFGSVAVVTPKKFTSESTFELYEMTKKERAAANASLTSLFKQNDQGVVPFEAVIGWLKKSPEFVAKEYLLTAAALNTLVGVMKDPHTVYLPAAYSKDSASAGSDDFTGIGIRIRTLQQSGRKVVLIETPIEGGPALKAGLRAGDVLETVDGVAVDGLSQEELTSKIQGAAGTKVALVVVRKGQPVTFTVVRAKISLPNVSSKMLPDSQVGYVKFASFMKEEGCEDVTKAVADLETQGAKALVFDLRNNGGGLLTQSVCIANIFMKSGERVVSIQSTSQGGSDRTLSTTQPRKTALPMVTLINARSASASELVAGALQDNQRSFLVGERSYGKGTVQNQVPVFGGKLILRQTIARFFLPSGRTNQIEGVTPDFVAYTNPNPTREDQFALREEDEYMAFPPKGPKWQQTRPEAVAKLQDCVSNSGKAKQTYEQQVGQAALPPDYQLLTATDVAACALAKGLGSADETHPLFAPPALRWNGPAKDIFQPLWDRLNQPLGQ